jgi:cbb3-type cytochrome oxidase maturation protein
VLLPLALLLGGTFLLAFIWAAVKGQYDDVETPRYRMLLEDNQIIQRKDGK